MLADEEIGDITPYNAQARKFREALKFANIGTSIKVASVEEFQGDVSRGGGLQQHIQRLG